jgi:hypothetical protein
MLWRFLLQNCNEKKFGESSAHIQLCEVAIQAPKDAKIVVTDDEDLVALLFRVSVQGIGQYLKRFQESSRG